MPPLRFVALVLVLAGGVGNQLDRVLQAGLVTDSINLGVGPLRTGIFNVADVAIACSAIGLIASWRGKSAD